VHYLFIIIGTLAGFLLLLRWASTADPKVLAWVARVLAGIVGALVLAVVLLTGRWTWIAYALPFLLPFYFHWRSSRIRAKNSGGPSPGQTSEVRTRYLNMSLDHDTGEMSGTVVSGTYAQRDVDSLNLAELLDLLAECEGDEDSVRVLEAFLDRTHGPAWRAEGDAEAGAKSGGGAWGGAMTFDEAWEILGLEPGSGEEEIKEAHRRLMTKMHPDRGGSTYLAAKLNQAKDLLLGT
jgi:hypothetical protein